jgi:hypothetical protein
MRPLHQRLFHTAFAANPEQFGAIRRLSVWMSDCGWMFCALCQIAWRESGCWLNYGLPWLNGCGCCSFW